MKRMILQPRGCAAPPPPPITHPNPPLSKFDAHRLKARTLIKNASEKRIEFEKNSLDKIAAWQANMKLVIKEDIQLIKIVLSGKTDIEL